MSYRKATITTSAPVAWSDGTLFTGMLRLALGYPTSSGTEWPSLVISDAFPAVKFPRWTCIPIKLGVLTGVGKAVLNADLTPPGSKYYAYWYDGNGKLIAPTAGSAVGFQITTESYVITPPTLTAPTASATGLTPSTQGIV